MIGIRCVGLATMYFSWSDAGVRMSGRVWPLTLTEILTGFRRPAWKTRDAASFKLALNRPVLRCFGITVRIEEIALPNSEFKSRSALSRIRTSN